MIRVSINPGTLIAGQLSVLTIGLSTTGLDACSDVVFRLKLPPGMVLVSGRDRIDVDEIRARQAHVHQVTVLTGRPGDVEVGTSNFSYRDEDGITRHQDDWRAPIRVLAPPPDQGGAAQASSPSSPSHPLPRLTVSHGGAKLALNKWDVLEVFLHNATGVPLRDVTLTLVGPFRADPASARIQLLRNGETWRAAISVHIPDRGKVPVSIHTTYRYRDKRGQLSSGAQDDRLTVEVAAPAETVLPRDEKAPVIIADRYEDYSINVRGNYVEEEIKVKAGGDIIGSQFGSHNTQKISDSFNTFAAKHGKQDDLFDQMQSLSEDITALVATLEVQDPNAAKEVTETFQSFVEESAKEAPKTGTLRALGRALVDAAKKVAKVAVPVATTVAAVLAIFGVVL
jgi:hypothetical protein